MSKCLVQTQTHRREEPRARAFTERGQRWEASLPKPQRRGVRGGTRIMSVREIRPPGTRSTTTARRPRPGAPGPASGPVLCFETPLRFWCRLPHLYRPSAGGHPLTGRALRAAARFPGPAATRSVPLAEAEPLQEEAQPNTVAQRLGTPPHRQWDFKSNPTKKKQGAYVNYFRCSLGMYIFHLLGTGRILHHTTTFGVF